MPKIRSIVPKYRRKRDFRGNWIALVTLDGKDIPLGTYGNSPSYTLYDALISAWLANGRRMIVHGALASSKVDDVPAQPVCVEEVAKAYQVHADT